jgi:hypothetical protein
VLVVVGDFLEAVVGNDRILGGDEKDEFRKMNWMDLDCNCFDVEMMKTDCLRQRDCRQH